jgi:hypothetical protein
VRRDERVAPQRRGAIALQVPRQLERAHAKAAPKAVHCSKAAFDKGVLMQVFAPRPMTARACVNFRAQLRRTHGIARRLWHFCPLQRHAERKLLGLGHLIRAIDELHLLLRSFGKKISPLARATEISFVPCAILQPEVGTAPGEAAPHYPAAALAGLMRHQLLSRQVGKAPRTLCHSLGC